MKVDLPEPEAPIMATNSPRRICTSMPRKASTLTSPRSYVFLSCSMSMMASTRDYFLNDLHQTLHQAVAEPERHQCSTTIDQQHIAILSRSLRQRLCL